MRAAGNIIRDSCVFMKALSLVPQNIIMTHACACVSVTWVAQARSLRSGAMPV